MSNYNSTAHMVAVEENQAQDETDTLMFKNHISVTTMKASLPQPLLYIRLPAHSSKGLKTVPEVLK